MESKTWWYEVKNQQKGPVSEDELKLLFAHNFITSENLIWRKGMAEWIKIDNIENSLTTFKPLQKNIPPPLPQQRGVNRELSNEPPPLPTLKGAVHNTIAASNDTLITPPNKLIEPSSEIELQGDTYWHNYYQQINKAKRFSTLPVILIICCIGLVGLGVWYFGLKKSENFSAINSRQDSSITENVNQIKGETLKDFSFNKFPIIAIYNGSKANIDYSSSPMAKAYKTRITKGYATGEISFSGYYVTIYWGCGTGCITGVMVDARDGKVYNLPVDEHTASHNCPGEVDIERTSFKVDSKLFITTSCSEEFGDSPKNGQQTITHFINVWNEEKKKFHKIKEIKEVIPGKVNDIMNTKNASFFLELREADKLLQFNSHEELVKIFGNENVQKREFDVREGQTAHCSILFPESERQVTFLWYDDQYTELYYISIGGMGEKFWKFPFGVKIDMPLEVLANINNAPLTIIGFVSDVGGYIKSFNGGKLGADKKISIRMDKDKLSSSQEEEYLELFYWDDINSSDLRVRSSSIKLAVDSIFLFKNPYK